MSILAELHAGVVTASADETRRLGARLAAALPPDAALALHGDLGVGKTTFVQGLAQGFGIPGAVTSPTFNILHLYRGVPGGRTLVHLDAYRLDNAHQVSELMLDDFLIPPYCLAVEWPEKIAAWLPDGMLQLTLGIEAPGRHRLMLA
ncbi:MAG: tRNA (adenosine(37)-N6)-threonylcarbamoyltransferase complex ATPase subunit type 1 TsaE [Opitutaceae bacterium]|nr:tRNA (adenosine(37)-N6)-threonylcarbamoyltransferase complex ATPase subunit type 1 TsaE [Opitutaceae bacterium]